MSHPFQRRLQSTLLLACLLASLTHAAEPVGRTKAAAIAQTEYGGRVLSVDEQDAEPSSAATDESPLASDVHYVVKLLQTGGRIKVVHLDANGNIL